MKNLKRLLSVLLAVIMFISIVPVSDIVIEAHAGYTLDDLKAKFPQGYYWNHYVTGSSECSDYLRDNGIRTKYDDSVSSTPCANHSASYSYSWYTGRYDCNRFNGATQCCGFAQKIAYLVYGSYCTSWSTGSLSSLKPGDVIHYYGAGSSSEWGHWAMVISVSGSTVKLGECNVGGNCKIRWDRTINTGSFSSCTVYKAPWSLSGESQTTYKIGQYKTTASSGLVLRGSASTSGSYLDLLPNGTTVYVTLVSGNWGYTSYNGQNGWICLDYAVYINHTHSYTSSITKNPTCYSVGVKTFTCSCGSSYTESISKTSHDYSGQKYKDSEHPHKISISCVNYSSCGSYQYTGEYAQSKNCSQCWNIKFTTTKNSITVAGGKSNTFTLGMTGSIYPDGAQYDWEYDEKIISVEKNGNDFIVTGLKQGNTDLVFTAYTDSTLTETITSLTIPVSVTGLYNILYFPNLAENEQSVSQKFASQIKYYGKDMTLITDKPEREGYSFLGWSTNKKATIPMYKSGGTYSTNSDAVFYAVWKKVFYGDVNEDGKISISDTTTLMNMISGSGVTVTNKLKGDLNGDGKLTEADKNLLSEFRTGDIYSFPVESMFNKLEVKSKPQKLVYKSGETISSTGLQINVVYNNNVTHTLNAGFKISPTTATGSGEQKITVTLGDWTTYFYITVNNHTHTYSSKITTKATCVKTGVKTYTCSCGNSYTETIAKSSHTWNSATCTTKKTCSICGTTTGSVAGHSYIAKITKSSTCTTNGVKTYTCSRCSDEYTEIIAKNAHSFTEKIIDSKHLVSAATTSSPAVYKYDCANCNTIGTTTFTHGSKLGGLGKTSKITATQSTSAVTLKWSAVNDANIYRVYQKNGGSWKTLGDVTKLQGTINKLSAGTKYTFAVKAGVKKGSNITWSSTYTTIDTATKTVKPSKVTAKQTANTITLNWTKCSGATGYRIYYKSGSAWKVAVSSTAATTHTFKNLKAGAKYIFAVRPYIKNGSTVIWSDYTTYTAATNPATVTAKASSPSKGKISLSWNAVNGADGYQVYYKTGNGSYKLYKTVGSGAKSLSFSNLKSGTKYTFAVRAGIKTSGGNIFGGYKAATVTVK